MSLTVSVRRRIQHTMLLSVRSLSLVEKSWLIYNYLDIIQDCDTVAWQCATIHNETCEQTAFGTVFNTLPTTQIWHSQNFQAFKDEIILKSVSNQTGNEKYGY